MNNSDKVDEICEKLNFQLKIFPFRIYETLKDV